MKKIIRWIVRIVLTPIWVPMWLFVSMLVVAGTLVFAPILFAFDQDDLAADLIYSAVWVVTLGRVETLRR